MCESVLKSRHLDVSASEQRKVIESLRTEEESAHVYCISKLWYDQWRLYVGLLEETTTLTPASVSAARATTPDRPGPLQMDPECDDNNSYVDEKIWKRWVDWYGLSDSHELDRRNWASDEKDFEICILSPYSGIVENPTKTFDISEEVGYIEVQLRKTFKVAPHRCSRLWVCEKARHARFTMMLDRSCSITGKDAIDPHHDYILGLEVGNLDSTWPSYVPGDPIGSLEKYTPLTRPTAQDGFWERELGTTVSMVFNGISNELSETVAGIVNTSKCVTAHRERDMTQVCEKLDAKYRGVEEIQKTLNRRAKDLFHEEEVMKSEQRRCKKEKESIDKEKQKFHDEMKKIEDMNKMKDSRVKLNIGGQVYMTSLMTITKDANSMLAAMFSGRHALKKEDDGSYFVDRDGTHFRFILNYLRDGGFKDGALSESKGFLNELLTEAEYYQIAGLIKLIRDMLKASGNDPRSSGAGSDGAVVFAKATPARSSRRKIAVIK